MNKINKHKIIKIILILITISIILLSLYYIVFSPFHFWFMKKDNDKSYVKGSNLNYYNGKLNIAYNDDSRLDIVGTSWTQSKFLCDKARLGEIMFDNICYRYNSHTLRVCDLNGNSDVEVTDNCTNYTTDGFSRIYFTNNSNQLYVSILTIKKLSVFLYQCKEMFTNYSTMTTYSM